MSSDFNIRHHTERHGFSEGCEIIGEDGPHKTTRVIKICRRIEEIEYILACKDRLPNEEDELLYEKEKLEVEVEDIQPTT